MNDEKKYLLGLTLAELKQVAKDLGMPAFTGGQMAKWLYKQHVKSIDEMTNISKANRAKLAAEYEIGCAGYTDAQHSVDGTIKYLFQRKVCRDGLYPRQRPCHALCIITGGMQDELPLLSDW